MDKVAEIRKIVNPVGALQEMSTKNGIMPVYEYIGKEGPDHLPTFTMVCKLMEFSETGISTSKKDARRKAAEKMLEKVHDEISVNQ